MQFMKEMLTHLADELNVKQVIAEADGGIYTLQFDTIKREATDITFVEVR